MVNTRRGDASAATIHHFYREYHGHTVDHLNTVIESVPSGRGKIFLVGDSTLDNKYWLNSQRDACNGYERVLAPPRSVPDVCFWMNRECEQRQLPFCCINCAIEESTLGLRQSGSMLPQDAVVQQHIRDGDILVVSCGGNDIALRPTAMTVVSMLTLLLSPRWAIEWGIAPGLSHFVRLFRDSTRRYVETLIGERAPLCVVVCMLYYLDEAPGGSWADAVLQKLGYDRDPGKLQLVMRKIYELGTQQVALAHHPTVEVVPVPLYEALDGRDSSDYVQRVEPSAQGGQKMAALIHDRIARVIAAGIEGKGGSQASAHDASVGTAAINSDVIEMPSAVHNRRR